MAAKLTRMIHKIAIQLYLVAGSSIICSSHSGRPVGKRLDTPSYITTGYVLDDRISIPGGVWEFSS
jgi:hypothetical protein